MLWLRLILVALLAGLGSGCGLIAGLSSSRPSRSDSLQRMDPVLIQADTMGFADRFVTTMSGIYDDLERRAATPSARDVAHRLKTDLSVGAISNAVNPRPVAGLIDMVVLVTLLRQIAEEPRAARVFGSDAVGLAEVLKRQEADIRSVASNYLTDPQLAELDELASRWHREHPDQQFVSHVHLAGLPEANRTPLTASGKLPSSVMGLLFFDPTANLDPAVREIALSRATSERMFFYLQRMPLLLQLQIEGFYRRALDAPELRRALDDASAVAASTTRFADTSHRFTDVVAKLPQDLSAERKQALEQFSAEVTQQRKAAIRELADAVNAQREAALAQATTRVAAERDQAIRQMASAMREEQQAFVAALQSAADRSILRLALVSLVLIALALGAALVYRRVKRRRPPA